MWRKDGTVLGYTEKQLDSTRLDPDLLIIYTSVLNLFLGRPWIRVRFAICFAQTAYSAVREFDLAVKSEVNGGRDKSSRC